MPQISKIRIANFQYNDGKRLIADELYDFERENKAPSDVLINLANGGGKSVLVQLMMQPIIPKAKVAGRRIESFFKKATDHCYVALEWSLDNSKMKLLTGIAMSASDASGDPDSERGFQIKYYTFLSAYQNNQGNYTIAALPFSRRENGKYIPAAFEEMRNLAKKSNGGLERYSSDDSARWQERLAQYGIVQNEWRMIEELNSNEDGLSKYFSNLKSSDAVIDKLIVPRIEEKQNHSMSRDDSSLETMLISYARQFSRQAEIIRERETFHGFCAMLEQTKTEANELWTANDSLEKWVEKLFAYADALRAEISAKSAQIEGIDHEKTRLEEKIRHIAWEKASAEYYTCREILERESENLRLAENEKDKATAKAKEAAKCLRLMECAHYYGQLKEIESGINAISAEMNDRENHSKEGNRLASLKYSARLAMEAELARITPELEQIISERNDCQKAIDAIGKKLANLQTAVQKARSEVDGTEAVLHRLIDEDSTLADKLEIGYRMLDGKYQEEDLQSRHKEMQDKEQAILNALDANGEKRKALENRIEAIPQEIADTESNRKEIASAADELTCRLEEFRTAQGKVKAVLERHGLDYALRFGANAGTYLNEKIAETRASMEDENRKIAATEEAIAAVNRGNLHIPKLLSEYLDATGLPYTTFENYLLAQQEKGLLSKADCQKLLSRYPYAAYGVKIGEQDRDLFYQEAEGKWLPAVLPIFTDSDVDKLLSGKAETFSAVAAYSQEYFNDRSSYEHGLQNTLARQNKRKALLEERVQSLCADKLIVDSFGVYDDSWESRTLTEIEKWEKNAEELRARITELQEEQKGLKEQISLARRAEKQLDAELRDVQNELSEFEKLCAKLQEEEALSLALEQARKALRDLQDDEEQAFSQKELKESECSQLEARIAERKATEKALKESYGLVAEAAEAEIISDEWKSLLLQYETLLKAQSADLNRLREEKDRLLKEKQEKQTEIRKRNCDKADYEQLVYSEEAENAAAEDSRSAEGSRRAAEEAFLKADRAKTRAEGSFDSACEKLKDHTGEPLPTNEVGKAFDERTAEARAELAELGKQEKLLADALSKLRITQGQAEAAMESHDRPAQYSSMELEADYAAQLNDLKSRIRACQAAVSESERKVRGRLRNMAERYGTASADVKRAVSSMQDLLSDAGMRGDRYYTLCEHIDANLHTAKLRISQIDTDLAEFHKTKDDLIHQCVIQGKQMYEGLMRLSNSSKVKVQGRRRQMLMFDIPNAVDENVAKANISAEIDKGTEEIASKMADGSYAESDIRKIAAATVGSRRLLRKYINADNIVLKAYKIDQNPDNSGYRTWEQTQVNNSGAEKFVVYFAVILALMAYTRDGYDDLGGKNKSVLVLDNPFGPISSRHVLEPMFEIARNYKVQMICLSDISKSDIVSCFELVIRAVVKQFALSSKEQLTHEGNEVIEHGFYRSEQMNLF